MSKRKQHHPKFNAKADIKKWITLYNHERPHSALGGKPAAVTHSRRNETTNFGQQEQKAV